MRPRQESMAALMNLKFQGVVVETLITDFEKVSCCLEIKKC